jgi:MoxR-like ATPase
LGRKLIRLQCYEGLDVSSAVYEWNYAAADDGDPPRRSRRRDGSRAAGAATSSPSYLVKRPLLQALQPASAGGPPVLLIDELDRTDEAFEAFLLEILSDFQVTIPELGTIKAEQPPIVIITSNRTREIHDALKRRCLYHWVDYPDARASSPSSRRRRRRRANDCRGSWSPSCRRCARKICSRRRASPKRWTGRAR